MARTGQERWPQALSAASDRYQGERLGRHLLTATPPWPNAPGRTRTDLRVMCATTTDGPRPARRAAHAQRHGERPAVQRHEMFIYEVTGSAPPIGFCAGEFSNGVWGFFVPAQDEQDSTSRSP